MDWLLRLQAKPNDPGLRRGLAAWIAADGDHARAWAQAERTWALIGAVPPVHSARWESAGRSAVRETPLPRRRLRWTAGRWAAGLGLAGAALAASLMLMVGSDALTRLRADQTTGAGELRSVTLADGSTVHLGPRSAIDTEDGPNRRGVRLLAGEAFFEVTPNPARPFVVEAGGVAVTVVGTAFDVRLDPASTTVSVKSGVVAVRHDGGPTMEERLGAGQRLTVDRAGGRTVRGEMAPGDVATWREGYLFVDNATVAEVVDELRRYQPGWILLESDQLAGRRVTGLYDLRQPERALQAIVQPHGGRLRTLTPFLHVLSMP
ncbi:FecR family protein [Azospirillum brasilense]|nr:FecR family protein [Azospirillum brasilense]